MYLKICCIKHYTQTFLVLKWLQWKTHHGNRFRKKNEKRNNYSFPPAAPFPLCYKIANSILNSASFFCISPPLLFPRQILLCYSLLFMVTHLCMVTQCIFKDKWSVYSGMFLVCLSSYYLVCCSHVLIYSVTFFTASGFKSLFVVGMRLSPQCQVQQSIHFFVLVPC